MSDTTFTQEDVDAKISEAVDAATADLQKTLDELTAQAQETEVGKAVAEAVAGKDTEISELTTKLDEAIIAKSAAEKLAEDTHTYFADHIEAAEQAKVIDAKRDERLAKVREFDAFDEDYLTEHADRWAALTDEDWDARLDEWAKLGVVAKEPKKDDVIPSSTAMTAAREAGGSTEGSALAALPMLRRGALGDPRTL